MEAEERKVYNNFMKKKSKKNESQDNAGIRKQKEAKAAATKRAKETSAERKGRNESKANATANKRAKETAAERNGRNESKAKADAIKRAKETAAEQKGRNIAKSKRNEEKRNKETEDEARKRKDKEKQQRAIQRANKIPTSQYEARNAQKILTGVQIVPELQDTKEKIGAMTTICKFCGARKWAKETPSMCCNSGKVVLDSFPDPPKLLKELLIADTSEARLFRNNARPLNNALTLSSLQVRTKTFDSGFAPNIIFEGKFCQWIGPMLSYMSMIQLQNIPRE